MADTLTFRHEKLDVYRLALKFVAWVDALINAERIGSRRGRRLDVLSTSIVLNTAEGNGRFLPADHYCHTNISTSTGRRTPGY